MLAALLVASFALASWPPGSETDVRADPSGLIARVFGPWQARSAYLVVPYFDTAGAPHLMAKELGSFELDEDVGPASGADRPIVIVPPAGSQIVGPWPGGARIVDTTASAFN
jgi:hypothetical protein